MAIMTIPRPIQAANDKDDIKGFEVIILENNKAREAQLLFCRFAKISEKDGVTTVDISEVPCDEQEDRSFYLSSREPLESFTGCSVEFYEENEGYWTYRIMSMYNFMQFDNV